MLAARGWTNRPVGDLDFGALLEEAKLSAYDTGYYSGKWNCTDLLRVAIARREECFAEIEKRMKGRKS